MLLEVKHFEVSLSHFEKSKCLGHASSSFSQILAYEKYAKTSSNADGTNLRRGLTKSSIKIWSFVFMGSFENFRYCSSKIVFSKRVIFAFERRYFEKGLSN